MVVSNLPVISFESINMWEQWLEKNHAEPSGIWIRFFKKNSGVQTITTLKLLRLHFVMDGLIVS